MEQRSKTNQIVKTSLALLTTFVISGCYSSQPSVAKSYPVWYTKVQQDSFSYYYGVADGINKTDAINNALNQIASKISVTIESNFESSRYVDNENLNEFSKSEIKNKVAKINFNNYTILKEQKVGNSYVVSLKVNRLTLAKNMEEKIENSLSNISSKLDANYKNIVQKLRNYSDAKQKLKELEKDVFLASSISSSVDLKEYLDTIHKLNKKILKFKNSISFKIDGDSNYKNVLSELINEKGYKVKNYNSNLYLKISVKKTHITAVGYKIAKGVINIKVIDKNNNSIVGQKRLVVGGKSLSGFKQADEFMLKTFKQKLLKEKILSNLLGV